MENLALTIKYYFEKQDIKIDLSYDVVVYDDGNGTDPYIKYWNISYPQPTMEELEALESEAMLYYGRNSKLAELNSKFDAVLLSGHCMSSLGFVVDANIASVRNIDGLLVVMDSKDIENFCDYNNEIHALTRQQIETLQVEIIKHIQSLYDKKWAYREKINACETAEELDKIVIDFGTENTKYFTDDMKIISRKISTNLIKDNACFAS